MRAVNLLPRETLGGRGGRGLDPLVAGGAALAVVVAAAVGGGFALEHSHATSAQQRLAGVRAQLAFLQGGNSSSTSHAPQPVLPAPTVTQQQLPWQAALTSALATRVAWDDVLAQLARVVPANVTVSTVTLGGATASGSTGSADGLTLGGTAFSEDGVAQLLSRLALVPDLSNVALTTSTADPKTGVVTFSVAAQVSPPVTASAAPSTGASS